MDNNGSEDELLNQEEYKRNLFGEELYQKIKEAEDDVKNNRVQNFFEFMKQFKEEIGYNLRNNPNR